MIAKADTISKSELHKFKIKIMSELVSNGVQIYQFPLDDETVAKVNTTMNVSPIQYTDIVQLLTYITDTCSHRIYTLWLSCIDVALDA